MREIAPDAAKLPPAKKLMDPISPTSVDSRSAVQADRARLGPVVAAELTAIQNDMEQAQELAAEYQRQLAGKSNELATLKQLFEKTRLHLIQLEASVTKLRDERHRLANEAMRAEALQRKLDVVTAERDRLKDEQARRMWGD